MNAQYWQPTSDFIATWSPLWTVLSKGRPAIPSDEIAPILATSGLPRQVLSYAWQLSDLQGMGALTDYMFLRAMRLVALAQAGYPLSNESLFMTSNAPLPFAQFPYIAPELQRYLPSMLPQGSASIPNPLANPSSFVSSTPGQSNQVGGNLPLSQSLIPGQGATTSSGITAFPVSTAYQFPSTNTTAVQVRTNQGALQPPPVEDVFSEFALDLGPKPTSNILVPSANEATDDFSDFVSAPANATQQNIDDGFGDFASAPICIDNESSSNPLPIQQAPVLPPSISIPVTTGSLLNRNAISPRPNLMELAKQSISPNATAPKVVQNLANEDMAFSDFGFLSSTSTSTSTLARTMSGTIPPSVSTDPFGQAAPSLPKGVLAPSQASPFDLSSLSMPVSQPTVSSAPRPLSIDFSKFRESPAVAPKLAPVPQSTFQHEEPMDTTKSTSQKLDQPIPKPVEAKPVLPTPPPVSWDPLGILPHAVQRVILPGDEEIVIMAVSGADAVCDEITKRLVVPWEPLLVNPPDAAQRNEKMMGLRTLSNGKGLCNDLLRFVEGYIRAITFSGSRPDRYGDIRRQLLQLLRDAKRKVLDTANKIELFYEFASALPEQVKPAPPPPPPREESKKSSAEIFMELTSNQKEAKSGYNTPSETRSASVPEPLSFDIFTQAPAPVVPTMVPGALAITALPQIGTVPALEDDWADFAAAVPPPPVAAVNDFSANALLAPNSTATSFPVSGSAETAERKGTFTLEDAFAELDIPEPTNESAIPVLGGSSAGNLAISDSAHNIPTSFEPSTTNEYPVVSNPPGAIPPAVFPPTFPAPATSLFAPAAPLSAASFTVSPSIPLPVAQTSALPISSMVDHLAVNNNDDDWGDFDAPPPAPGQTFDTSAAPLASEDQTSYIQNLFTTGAAATGTNEKLPMSSPPPVHANLPFGTSIATTPAKTMDSSHISTVPTNISPPRSFQGTFGTKSDDFIRFGAMGKIATFAPLSEAVSASDDFALPENWTTSSNSQNIQSLFGSDVQTTVPSTTGLDQVPSATIQSTALNIAKPHSIPYESPFMTPTQAFFQTSPPVPASASFPMVAEEKKSTLVVLPQVAPQQIVSESTSPFTLAAKTTNAPDADDWADFESPPPLPPQVDTESVAVASRLTVTLQQSEITPTYVQSVPLPNASQVSALDDDSFADFSASGPAEIACPFDINKAEISNLFSSNETEEEIHELPKNALLFHTSSQTSLVQPFPEAVRPTVEAMFESETPFAYVFTLLQSLVAAKQGSTIQTAPISCTHVHKLASLDSESLAKYTMAVKTLLTSNPVQISSYMRSIVEKGCSERLSSSASAEKLFVREQLAGTKFPFASLFSHFPAYGAAVAYAIQWLDCLSKSNVEMATTPMATILQGMTGTMKQIDGVLDQFAHISKRTPQSGAEASYEANKAKFKTVEEVEQYLNSSKPFGSFLMSLFASSYALQRILTVLILSHCGNRDALALGRFLDKIHEAMRKLRAVCEVLELFIGKSSSVHFSRLQSIFEMEDRIREYCNSLQSQEFVLPITLIEAGTVWLNDWEKKLTAFLAGSAAVPYFVLFNYMDSNIPFPFDQSVETPFSRQFCLVCLLPKGFDKDPQHQSCKACATQWYKK